MKRVVTIVLSAVLFGVLAGGTMAGINVVSQRMIAENGTEAAIEESASGEAENAAEPESAAAERTQEEKVSTDSEGTAQLLDVSGIVEEAMPQVVSITNTMLIKQRGYSSIFDYLYGGGYTQEYVAEAAGSGVIVNKTDDELLILTNNHVIEDSTEISVTFIDGETVNAAIKGTDSTMDLAVVAVNIEDIKQETMDVIKVATLHDTEDLKAGQGVIAIGNALGFGQSVTVGYISALDREITTEEGAMSGLIQVDAAINPGNSGGALLNTNGELIGINVAKLANTEIEGVGYAIPIYKAMDVIEGLSNAKAKVEIPEEEQGRLGVLVKTIPEQYAAAYNMPKGVLVYGFDDEDGKYSAAKEAGIWKNDVITKFDGQSVNTAEELTRLVKYYEAGSVVKITVERLENGEYTEKEFEVTLGENTEAKEAADSNAEDSEARNGSGEGEERGDEPMQGENNPNGDIFDMFKDFLEQYQ